MIRLFEAPLPPGWVYPCSIAEIEERLSSLPAADVAGIYAVGLALSYRKENDRNATYKGGANPVIRIYSWIESLTFKMPNGVKRKDIDRNLSVELEYGMSVESVGSRYVVKWKARDLRCFILEHVLAHEVGHHVFHLQRGDCDQTGRLSVVSEQFAEAYARRMAVRRPMIQE